jgi:hypothetical protein
MATKEYVFNHAYDAATATEKIRPVLAKFAHGFRLDLAQDGPDKYQLTTSGCIADVKLEDNKATVTVELNMMMEAMFRKMLETTLDEKLKPAIEKM